jgi:hypothetical protein
VFVEHLLVEQPLGDPFLNRDLWATAPPAAAPAVAALLAENGVRTAVFAGTLPPKFRDLVTSEPDVVSARRFAFGNAKETVVPTAGPHDPCAFEFLPDLAGRRAERTFAQARCGVLVRPEPAPDGRVKLRCEPQIQHGERREWLRPTADATEFVMQGEVPTERFPALAFDVTIGPNEYLLIGWQAEQDATLGAALFGADANGRPRQRVLVLRAGQLGRPAADLPPLPPSHRRPPVAAEASRR